MTGHLTLKGVTRAVTLEVESNGLAASPDGRTRFGLGAAGELRRSDFGIEFAPIGLDRLALADKVDFELDMQFVQPSVA
jgi:polyisoprenoid-binding protein YceI